MPETCKVWFGLINSNIYFARHMRDIYQELPYSVDYKASMELWDPLSETVLSKCGFICNKWSAKIWNNCKAQR